MDYELDVFLSGIIGERTRGEKCKANVWKLFERKGIRALYVCACMSVCEESDALSKIPLKFVLYVGEDFYSTFFALFFAALFFFSSHSRFLFGDLCFVAYNTTNTRTQTRRLLYLITTSTTTSLLHPAFESVSFHALTVSISSTFSQCLLTRTQCAGIGRPNRTAKKSFSIEREGRSETYRAENK